MAHIRTRQTADGTRYDVRYIINGTERSDSFRSKSDAESRLTKVRADELVGLVTDPRGGSGYSESTPSSGSNTDW